MFTLVDCNNFWSPSGGGVRRYHLEKMSHYKRRTDIKYHFIMHDEWSYTEQIGPNAYIEHIKVPKVLGQWEYRYVTHRTQLEPIILSLNPDIIEVGSPYFLPGIIHGIIKKHHLKAKVVGFWHADFPITYVKRFFNRSPFISKYLEKQAWKLARKRYNSMAGTQVSSHLVLQRMKKKGMKKLHFMPLGVDSELFEPQKKDESWILELKENEARRMILFFPHRFCHEKGLPLLLQAYDILEKTMEIKPILLLAGTGPLIKQVKKAEEKHRHVHYLGFIKEKSEMAMLYASSDLGFALSRWETFGLSLIEAMSAGLPLIGACDGASKEHLNKSGAGYLLQHHSPQELADKILAFCQLKNHKQLKAKATQYASNMTWEKCFNKQVELYTNILKAEPDAALPTSRD